MALREFMAVRGLTTNMNTNLYSYAYGCIHQPTRGRCALCLLEDVKKLELERKEMIDNTETLAEIAFILDLPVDVRGNGDLSTIDAVDRERIRREVYRLVRRQLGAGADQDASDAGAGSGERV